MIRTSALAGLAAAALVLGACGSDGGGEDEEAAPAADSRTEDQTGDAGQDCPDGEVGSDGGSGNDGSEGDAGSDDDEAGADGDDVLAVGDEGESGTGEDECAPAGDDPTGDDPTDDGTASAGSQTITSSGDHTCDGGDIAIQGNQLEVTLTGPCGAVTISGNAHDVEVESAETITLDGVGHDLDHGGDAEVVDRSIDSDVD